MNTSTTVTNTSIPIAKMVNDLFLQWISLIDTRTTLCTALQSVRTNSKLPDPIVYPKVRLHYFYVDNKLFFLLSSIFYNRLIQYVAEAFLSHNISIHHLFHLCHAQHRVHETIYHRFFQLENIRLILVVTSKIENNVH